MRQVGRRSAGLLVGATLTAGALSTAPGTSTATAQLPRYRAVVAVASPQVALPGVQVLHRFSAVGSAVVVGTRPALTALAHRAGVLGVSPDSTLSTASRDHSNGSSVYAWQGLGGQAGKPKAGAGVTVALLDTGVTDTAVLNRASARLVDGVDTSELAEGGAARTSGTFTDGYGHGTFMASLIAGGAPEGSKKPVGVAPMSRVVVVKVADAQGETSLSEVLAGLDWIAVQAPKIQLVNIALAQDKPGARYGEDPLTVAVEHVQAAGVAVVAAVGNTPGEVGDPGLDPRVLTVGAADLTGDDGKSDGDAGKATVASFSGYGDVAGVRKPDLVASGVGVLGVLPADSTLARSFPDAKQANGLWRGSGTSQSTAIATGVAAEFLSSHPDATLSQVKPSLRAAADRIGAGRKSGQGLLDMAEKAVAATPQSTGEAGLNASAFRADAWLGGSWRDQLDQAWSPTASSWSASSCHSRRARCTRTTRAGIDQNQKPNPKSISSAWNAITPAQPSRAARGWSCCRTSAACISSSRSWRRK